MTVRMSIFRKLPHLGAAEFQSYWQDVHAPIALRIPALQRYEQNCVVDTSQTGDPAHFDAIDGVCKLSFADEAAMQGVMSPEMRQMLMDDEAQFLEGLRTFVVRPVTPVPVAAGALTKCVSLVTRKGDLGAPEFEARWSGPFAARMRELPGIRGYAQNFVTARTAARQPASYAQVPVDCIDELWLEPAVAADAIARMQRHAADHAATLNIFVVTVNVPTIPGKGEPDD